MSYTERFTETHELETGLPPVNRVANTYNTPWISMSNFHRVVYVLRTGAMAGGATLTCLLQEATDGAGAGVQAIAGHAITQLTQAGGDANDIAVIELQTEEMDVDGNFDFVRAQLVVAVAAVFFDVHGIRFIPRFAPVSVAAITEVVD